MEPTYKNYLCEDITGAWCNEPTAVLSAVKNFTYLVLYSYLPSYLILYHNLGKRIPYIIVSCTCLTKKIMRLVTLADYNSHTANLFIKFDTLRIHDIYKLQLLTFMLKLKNHFFTESMLAILHSKFKPFPQYS